MVNRVVLIGRLTRDPALRDVNGKAVAEFSLAVDGRGKDAPANFFRIVTWERQADYVINYLGKGRLVAVEGRLQSRKYADKEGNNREIVEIVADNVQGLDRPRDDAAPAQTPAIPTLDEYDPFSDE